MLIILLVLFFVSMIMKTLVCQIRATRTRICAYTPELPQHPMPPVFFLSARHPHSGVQEARLKAKPRRATCFPRSSAQAVEG